VLSHLAAKTKSGKELQKPRRHAELKQALEGWGSAVYSVRVSPRRVIDRTANRSPIA
jgi:hypothetical protein